MAIAEKGPNHNLAQRITDLETAVQKLSTQDVLLNATFGPGLTVNEAYNLLLGSIATASSPAVASASTSSFVLTTSFQNLANFHFTVPTGYTRALIFASGSVGGASGASGGDRLTVVTQINSVTGPSSVGTMSSSTPFASVAAFQTASLTGLSVGQSIPVAVFAVLQVGPGSGVFASSGIIVAQALFLP